MTALQASWLQWHERSRVSMVH